MEGAADDDNGDDSKNNGCSFQQMDDDDDIHNDVQQLDQARQQRGDLPTVALPAAAAVAAAASSVAAASASAAADPMEIVTPFQLMQQQQQPCPDSAVQPPLPSRNLAIPDIDDMSMVHVFSYMDHYEVDLFWSFLSDSFFIAGSSAYIGMTIWDYWCDSVETEGPLKNNYYILLDVIAPLVYLFNSMVDIEWATHVQQRLKDKYKLTKHWEESAARFTMMLRGDSLSSMSDTSSSSIATSTVQGISITGSSRNTAKKAWCNWHRFLKHAAHRRTVLAALTFGLAASLAVMAAVVRNWFNNGNDDETERDAALDAVSCHVYVLSAVISLTGQRHRPWLAASSSVPGADAGVWYDPERLEDLGDLLFLIGSLVDSALMDFRLNGHLYLPVLSSFLWFLDGCLYMRSDLVKAFHLREATRSEGIADDASAVIV